MSEYIIHVDHTVNVPDSEFENPNNATNEIMEDYNFFIDEYETERCCDLVEVY